MFGVSIPEILLVCVVILIVLGPDRMPGAARNVARILGQLRRQADAVRRELYNSMYIPADEIKQDVRKFQDNLRAVKEEVRNIIPPTPEELMTCEDKARLEEDKRRKAEAETSEKVALAEEGSAEETIIKERESENG